MIHAPKLTGAGRVVGMSESHIEIDRASIQATEWHQGYYDLLHVAGGVRITIEPYDAPETEPLTGGDADMARADESEDLRALADGGAVRVIVEPAGEAAEAHERIALAVDLLSQLKRAIGESGVQSSIILRCLHLANAAHGALLGANDQHDPVR